MLLSSSVAPIKALCSQRFEDWNKKFGPLGLSCKELTGDTEIDDFFEIQDANIIITTPVSDTVSQCTVYCMSHSLSLADIFICV